MIARMDRLEIVCLRGVLPELISVLQGEGIVHVEEVPLVVENAPDYLHRIRMSGKQKEELDSLEELERLLKETMPLLTTGPKRKSSASTAQAISEGRFENWPQTARQWCRELRSLTRREVNIRDNIEILQNYRRILKTLEPVLEDKSAVMGKGARAMVLEGEATKAVERLKARFAEEAGPECRFVYEKTGRKSLVGLVSYPESQERIVAHILHEEGVIPVEAPDKSLQGVPLLDMLARVDAMIARQRQDLEQLEEERNQLSREHGDDMLAMSLSVADRLAQIRVVNQLAQSQMIGVAHGWAPHDRVAFFTEKLRAKFGDQVAVMALDQEGLDRRWIPTLLKNPKLFKPFEVLLSLFRPPTYGTYDPTIIVAISFILFYGFILGDVIYGLAVIAFAIFLGKKWGHIEAVKSASIVGTYMGISGVVFGVLYGEYAGSLFESLFGFKYLWFHRGHETDKLLLLAVVLGAVHVSLGLLLGVWENYRRHHTKHALEKLGLLLGLAATGILVSSFFGLAPFNRGVFSYLALLLFLGSATLLVKGMGLMALLGVLEILSLAGNVLSYARLMALGIASIALAEIANQTLQLNPMLGIPLALIIHLFNVTIGMFSPIIHSLRLNYVEFLPKFYVPEGRVYKPFRKEAI